MRIQTHIMESDFLYLNRRDASLKLAFLLNKYVGKNTLVLGIPRGGVEIAYYVSKFLYAELSVIIAKKIPHPNQPEYGIGAIAENNVIYIPDYINIAPEIINNSIPELKKELARRKLLYRKGKELPQMNNRIVLLVDDGIATGVTMVAAIRFCKIMKALKIIIATPVASTYLNKDLNEADEIIIHHQSKDFGSVGKYYKDFTQLSDKDVLTLLNLAS